MPVVEVNLGRLFTYPFDSQVRSIQGTRAEKPERLVAWFRAQEARPEEFRRNYELLDEAHKEKLASLQRAFEILVEREFALGNNQNHVTALSLTNGFRVMPNFVRLVARKGTHALMIVGPGGVGKSYTVRATLLQEGRQEGRDWIRIPGYASPLGLYSHLYDHKNKLVFFDDCDQIFKCEHGLNILKSTLDTLPRRVVTWRSVSTKVPTPEFEFTGQVIFASNMDPNEVTNPHFRALLTRIMTLVLGGSREEILMHVISKMPDVGADLPTEQREEILGFLKDNYRQYNNFSIRTLRDLIALRKAFPTEWQDMARSLN